MKNKLCVTALSAIILSLFTALFPLSAQANAGSKKGDVNLDGAFNISDVVILQKWLLAVPDIALADSYAADFNDDSKIDVFDLCLMKKALDAQSDIEPSVNVKQIDVANILQNPELPTGCESVSLTILLNHIGFSVDKMTLVRDYLPKLDFYWYNGVYYGADFRTTFAGNPESANSYGCYAPCITTTANNYFSDNELKSMAYDITGMDFDGLLNDYVYNDIPVLIWITSSNLHETMPTSIWTTPAGEKVQWLAYEHCVVLTGYDKDKSLVYISDPLIGNTSCDYSRIKQRYIDMGQQAVCIKRNDIFLNNKLLISGTNWYLHEDNGPTEKAIEFSKDGISGYYIIFPENIITMESTKIPFIYETKGDEITLHIADSANNIIKAKLSTFEWGYTLPFEWADEHTENFRMFS